MLCIVERAALKITGQIMMKKSTARTWCPIAERALYNLCMAKRKKLKVGVHPLALYNHDWAEKKKHYPTDPHGETFKASWRWDSKWANKNKITKRRRSNSKNQSIEERLPMIRRLFSQKLTEVDAGPRARASWVNRNKQAQARMGGYRRKYHRVDRRRWSKEEGQAEK